MFSPEMMQAASQMMQNMKPEDMERMSKMASGMDPKVMENMMKSMGGDTSSVDMKQVSDQFKNMSPEQMKAQMSQAQNQMSAQKTYYFNAAQQLKNDGNAHIKNEKYAEALPLYDRAIENLKPHAGDDVVQLSLSCLLNAALCHLKLKEYGKCINRCGDILKISPKNVKAIYRRGLALYEQAKFAEALADVRLASQLSPSDQAIGDKLSWMEAQCKAKGVDDAAVKAAEKKVKEETSAAPKAGGGLPGQPRDMNQAMDHLAKNPDMLNPDMVEQATKAMQSMPKEELDKLMKNAPLPPGMDSETMRKQMEAVAQNPDMVKTAMESLKAMPEEERRKMLAQRASASGMNPGDVGEMSKVFDNPDMMKSVAEMAKNMEGGGGEADMMAKAAAALSSNPDLGAQMSNMMKNMSPEQMQSMMEMSSKMRGGGGASSSSSGPPGPGGMDAEAMDKMMNDPDMMKMAENMMKSMDPATISAMAKQSGIDLDEDKAKMISKLMPVVPYLMKGFRCCSRAKKAAGGVFTNKGRIILAAVVLLAAILQHYRTA